MKVQDLPIRITQLGPMKLKKKEGEAIEIADKTGNVMVVKRIRVFQAPGQNNRVIIVLDMPDPERIEIVVTPEKLQVESEVIA